MNIRPNASGSLTCERAAPQQRIAAKLEEVTEGAKARLAARIMRARRNR